MFTADPSRPAGLNPLFGAVLALSAAGAAQPAGAQERQVVSNRVTVSDADATLSLEFDSGPALEISFQNGEVRVDGEEVGSYQAGGELAASWRSLLSEVVPLDGGPLAEALLAWEPGTQLSGDARAAAERVDRALQEALAGARPEDSPMPRISGSAEVGGMAPALVPPLLRLLLQRGRVLEEALQDVDLTELSLHLGEDVTVDAGTDIEGALLVVEGDATISGEVPGDVVVVEGTLRIEGDAYIGGEVRVIDGQLERDGGTVEGTILTVDAGDAAGAGMVPDAAASGDEERGPPSRQGEARARLPFRYVTSGLSGLFGDVFWLVVILAVGTAVVHFAGDRLQNVAEVVRAAPGRAALVGLAGGFLLLPLWVLGGLALLVSIIGIPLLVAWLPLFPLAALLAGGLGYLAVASVVGEWLARKGIPALDRFRPSNRLHVLAVGLAALVLPSALSHVTEMGGPTLGSFLSGLFTLVAVATAMIALMLGFGAVLLTGAGRTSDPGRMAATYGGGIRATRAWTRRRSRRRSREKPGHPDDGGTGE